MQIGNSVWQEYPDAYPIARDLWNKNTSAGKIAITLSRKFSARFTRAAVCGKLNRKGDGGKGRLRIGVAKETKQPARKRGLLSPAFNGSGHPLHLLKTAPFNDPECAELPPTAKELKTLNSGDCHWPLWGNGSAHRFYCGATTRTNSPYCPWHHARSYVPARRVFTVQKDYQPAKG